MSGRTVVLIIAFILSGCSAVRKAGVTSDKTGYGYKNLIERVIAGNITRNNFNITKADIEVENSGKKQKLMANLKYRTPGIYLLSVRNKTGIEAARAYITKDTMMINDKIYKKLYCGSTEYLSEKYGISINSLPLITGDFLYNFTEGYGMAKCENGIEKIQGYLNGKRIWYSVDCNKEKVAAVSVNDIGDAGGIRMEFSNFKESDSYVFPGTIQIEDFTKKTRIRIDISDVIFNTKDSIVFLPGRNYDKIMLK